MQIPVLLKKIDKGYRARAGDPFCLTAEGKTSTEALGKLEQMMEERWKAGARIVYIDMPRMDPPMARWAGSLDPDDPEVQEWERIMAENRRKADEDPNFP